MWVISGWPCAHCGPLPRLPQELWVYSNRLASVPPELSSCVSLRRMWLDRNELTAVPRELAALSNLQELYLDQNEGLRGVPPELLALPTLRKLYLGERTESAMGGAAQATHVLAGSVPYKA